MSTSPFTSLIQSDPEAARRLSSALAQDNPRHLGEPSRWSEAMVTAFWKGLAARTKPGPSLTAWALDNVPSHPGQVPGTPQNVLRALRRNGKAPGFSALLRAAVEHNAVPINFLDTDNHLTGPLALAALFGSTRLMAWLIERGAEVNPDAPDCAPPGNGTVQEAGAPRALHGACAPESWRPSIADAF